MPKIKNDVLYRYFSSNGSLYPLHTEAVDIYEALRVHAEGVFPEKLLAERRPSEGLEIMEYRRKTYQAITKLPVSKVINSFGKIRRSPDWAIKFPEATAKAIIEGETLEEYCTQNLPGFKSLEEWIFGLLLRRNLIDPNSIVAVIPMEVVEQNKYALPVPLIFATDHVIEFREREQWCILKARKKINYLNDVGDLVLGERYYYIDDKEIIIYDQTKAGWEQVMYQKNYTKRMPAWKVKAEVLQTYEDAVLNQSRMHAMVPFLNKAAVADSDLDGSKVQHLYPLFWYIDDKECPQCSGLGTKTATVGGGKTNCVSCKGTGKVPFTPFSHIRINAGKLGAQQTPTPPAGYVQRDTAILELQEKLVEKNNLKALSAINMQFLDQTPLSISGDAKAVDREELNNTVYTVAEDIVYSAEKVIYFINEWRYSTVIPNAKKRREQLPNIATPQNFDLLPENYLLKEVTDARTAKVNPLLIAELESDIAAKKFYNRPSLAENVAMYFDLDPLPGYSADDKMSMLMNKGITPEDYVISNYMAQFIKRAVIEDKDFVKKPYAKKMEVLQSYATEKTTAIDAAAALIDEAKQKVIKEMEQDQPPVE